MFLVFHLQYFLSCAGYQSKLCLAHKKKKGTPRVCEVKEVLRHACHTQGILPLELFSSSVLSTKDGKLKLHRTYGCHIAD